jgi:hypothetical protein
VIDWSKSVELYASALQALTVIPFIGVIEEAGSAETGCRGKESKVNSSKIRNQTLIVTFNCGLIKLYFSVKLNAHFCL